MGIELIGPSLGALQAAGAVPTLVRKTVTFAAGTTGAVGAHDLFTVTGDVLISALYGKCTTNITDAGGGTPATLALATGSVSITDGGAIDPADGWDAGEWWRWTSSSVAAGDELNSGIDELPTSSDITYTIANEALTAGVVVFYLHYIPLSAGASVVAA